MQIDELLLQQNPWWRDPTAGRVILPRRRVVRELLDALGSPGRAAVLVGMRQVGKSVAMRQVIDELLHPRGVESPIPAGNVTYFDFEDERVPLGTTPQDVIDRPAPRRDPRAPRILLFDEITKAASWDRWLKRAVDAARTSGEAAASDRIAVTDSSASLLSAGQAASAVGRTRSLRVRALSFSEAISMFGDRAGEAEIIDRLWRRFLVTGGFPGQLFDQHRSFDECRRDLRNDIVGLALQRDLPVENADPRVRALFVYLVQNSGAELDARVRAQELDADKRSVQAWIEWLEAAALVERVPRFTAKPAVRLRAAQKCFASDHGLVAAFAPEADPLGDEGVRGRITETLALGILRDVIGDRAAHLAFGVVEKPAGEIDFVFEWGGARIGVEVTAAPPKSEKVAAVHVARSALKLDRALLIHGGDAARIGEAVSSVPLRDFASDPERFLVGAAR